MPNGLLAYGHTGYDITSYFRLAFIEVRLRPKILHSLQKTGVNGWPSQRRHLWGYPNDAWASRGFG